MWQDLQSLKARERFITFAAMLDPSWHSLSFATSAAGETCGLLSFCWIAPSLLGLGQLG